MTQLPNEPIYREIQLSELFVEATWQKERFDQRFANHVAATFRPELCDPLRIAIDSEGKYQVWDGQHRLHALRTLGVERWMCVCIYADERAQAELFDQQANRKSLTWSNKHAARVQYMESSREIDQIVTNHGFILSPGHENTIRAVSTIYSIFERSSGSVLDRTLNIMKQSWPDMKAARCDIILDGIATFLQAYGNQTVDTNTIAVLGKTSEPLAFMAGATRMCAKIKDKSGFRPAKKYEAFALYMAKEYGRANNMKLHSKWILATKRGAGKK